MEQKETKSESEDLETITEGFFQKYKNKIITTGSHTISKTKEVFQKYKKLIVAAGIYTSLNYADYFMTITGSHGDWTTTNYFEGNPFAEFAMRSLGPESGLFVYKACMTAGVILGSSMVEIGQKNNWISGKEHKYGPKAKWLYNNIKGRYILYGGIAFSGFAVSCWLFQENITEGLKWAGEKISKIF